MVYLQRAIPVHYTPSKSNFVAYFSAVFVADFDAFTRGRPGQARLRRTTSTPELLGRFLFVSIIICLEGNCGYLSFLRVDVLFSTIPLADVGTCAFCGSQTLLLLSLISSAGLTVSSSSCFSSSSSSSSSFFFF